MAAPYRSAVDGSIPPDRELSTAAQLAERGGRGHAERGKRLAIRSHKASRGASPSIASRSPKHPTGHEPTFGLQADSPQCRRCSHPTWGEELQWKRGGKARAIGHSHASLSGRAGASGASYRR